MTLGYRQQASEEFRGGYNASGAAAPPALRPHHGVPTAPDRDDRPLVTVNFKCTAAGCQ